MEKWKEIKGYEGLYQISSQGCFYSYPRPQTKGGFKTGNFDKDGYLRFALYKNGVKTYKRLHRLVYETFVGSIPNGYEVHHKNHIKTDNRVENLELIKRIEHNKIHIKDRVKGVQEKMTKPVLQFTLNGELVNEYPSTMEAERQTGINNRYISRCCLKQRKTAGGFVWQYVA